MGGLTAIKRLRHTRQASGYMWLQRAGSYSFSNCDMLAPPPYRLFITSMRSQYIAILHSLHRGEMGLQRFCPNVTRSSLYIFQYLRGNLLLSASSVFSGVFVFM